jgi:ferredoxin
MAMPIPGVHAVVWSCLIESGGMRCALARANFTIMRLLIDEDRCSGHGRCYTLVPSLFDSDEQGHGVVLVDAVAADQVDAARSAVLNCPEQAISLLEE